MQQKVRWEEMFPDELEAAIAARPVCYLAYGLAEPHGVQNAIGLDGLKAQALVEAAAQAHGGVAAPMTWWHVHETPRGLYWLTLQNAPMPRLTNVPADLFLRQLVYQLRAVEIAGFKAAILVTGHYGGIEIDMRVTAQIYAMNRPLRATALADWEIMTYADYRGDHAGVCETSQLWALRPELVDLSRMPAEPFEGKLFASDEHARKANRREGEKIMAAQVESLKNSPTNYCPKRRVKPAPGFPSRRRKSSGSRSRRAGRSGSPATPPKASQSISNGSGRRIRYRSFNHRRGPCSTGAAQSGWW